jgi:hypothetical protein
VQPPKDTQRNKYSKQVASADEQNFNIFRHIAKGRDANNTFAKSLKNSLISTPPMNVSSIEYETRDFVKNQEKNIVCLVWQNSHYN